MNELSLGAREAFLPSTLYGCLAEFIATLLFIFVGCGSVISSGILENEVDSARLLVIAIAHGFGIVMLVSATSGVSGGHLNPAVSFGFVISGNMSLVKGIMYCISQLAGASLGALYYRDFPSAIAGHYGAQSVNPKFKATDAFGLEVLLTFVLVYVIFGTAVDKKGPSHIAPLAIGMTVIVNAIVGIPISGASMNPARSFGAAIWSGQWKDHWIYWAGPLLGSSAASILYTALFLPYATKEDVTEEDVIETQSNSKLSV